MHIKIFFLLLCTFQHSESANILGIFPMAGKSLNILYDKLMVALANAGHDITMISAYKPQEKIENGSLAHIYLTGFVEAYEEALKQRDIWSIEEVTNMFDSKEIMDVANSLWDKAFKIPEVKALLNSNQKFDAVIMEESWSDCFKILSQIFNCPLIMFASTGGNNPYVNADIGNPLLPSYVPYYLKVGPYFKGMNFWQRLHNFVVYMVDTLIRYWYMFPAYNKILQDNFQDPPDVATFYDNISLVLLGSHSSIRQPTPLAPNEIEIGGFHIDAPKKLPKDLQDFLDGAKNGAIYFSLGSHLDSKNLPTSKIKMFRETFRKLKQRVLWKFEEELVDQPNNVLTKEWMPQMDILAHPNMKLFISHAGQGSILEAVYHGMPCLMFPIFFDQFNNAYQAVQNGFALKLDYKRDNEVTLMNAIEEMLNNPQYLDNAKKVQRQFHDRPMKPIDTAIYWIEYVIRHKGAEHLRIAGYNMPWYQFYCVDVVLFILASFLFTVFSLYLVFSKFLYKLIRRKQKRD